MIYEPNFDKYERLTESEAFLKHGIVAETDGSGVLYRRDGETEVFILHSTEANAYACEIDNAYVFKGQGFGESPYEALIRAVMDCDGYDVLDENPNMEDAMNILCYGTFEALYGDLNESRLREVQDDGCFTSDIIGMLWTCAAEFVKEHCEDYGFEFDMSWAE